MLLQCRAAKLYLCACQATLDLLVKRVNILKFILKKKWFMEKKLTFYCNAEDDCVINPLEYQFGEQTSVQQCYSPPHPLPPAGHVLHCVAHRNFHFCELFHYNHWC